MSALTKVFVVLHVVLSMLLVSGMVVFVNRTEDFRTLNKGLQTSLQQAKSDAQSAQSEVAAARADLIQKLNVKDAEINSAHQSADALQQQVNDLNGKLADASANNAQAQVAVASATEALKVAQQQNAAIETNFAALRTSQDTLQKQYTDSGLHITELQNQLDVTEKQRRYLAEQVTQLTAENSQQAEVIHKNLPMIENRQGQPAINATPAIALNGVVRDKTIIAGVPYATISIGSADAVRKDMQFKVVDPSKNQFLGYLTVDSVEPHEATGRLEGPHVDGVRAGAEVRTQL